MRRGEILGLQWDDIDFAAKMIHVRHNAVLGRYKTSVSDMLKTNAGRRSVPLSTELEKYLQEQQTRSKSKYVLCLRNNKVMTLSSFRSMWKLIERELPEHHITAHLLRHTYITRFFEAGLDVKEIQYLAGHSTMDMTLRVSPITTEKAEKHRQQKKCGPPLKKRPPEKFATNGSADNPANTCGTTDRGAKKFATLLQQEAPKTPENTTSKEVLFFQKKAKKKPRNRCDSKVFSWWRLLDSNQ